jgi:hypothetical protein
MNHVVFVEDEVVSSIDASYEQVWVYKEVVVRDL